MGRQFHLAFTIEDLALGFDRRFLPVPNEKFEILHDKCKRPRGVVDAYLSAKEENQVQILARIPFSKTTNSSKH